MLKILTTMLDELDQGVALCDPSSLCVIESNQTLTNWLAFDSSSASLEAHFEADQIKRIRRAVKKDRTYRFSKPITKGAQSEVIAFNVRLAHFESGEDRLLLQGVVDYSAREMAKLETFKETYNKLLVEKDRAEAANQAKTEFIATMSHELRTPINSILGMTQQMAKTELGGDQIRYLETIKGSGTQLLAIINSILDFSKIEAGKLELNIEPTDINQLVQDVVGMSEFDPHLKEQVELRYNAPTIKLPTLDADPIRLKQILLNLVSNAIKFTQQGHVALTFDYNMLDVSSEYLLVFSVIDTGIGMEQAKIAQLFEPFTQAEASTTRRFGGTGLGLAITKSLVELMHGEINATSEVGKGSRFEVQLKCRRSAPQTTSDGTAKHDLSSAIEQVNLDGMTILVVDDTPLNCELVGLSLDEYDINLLTAEDGEQAVKVFQENAVDLIFMDCLMPNMDGFDATRAIRAWARAQPGYRDDQATPIIGLTASLSKEINQQCFDAGMDEVMLKPFNFPELVKMVQSFRARQ